jgi:hypothetical protein
MAGAPAEEFALSGREALLADYVAAEGALRAFTDRNFGRLCAICARWTLLAARTNEGLPALRWPLSSWVTNCCNANHALESMDESTLAGIVASRQEGQEWWRRVRRANRAPCAALTETGCHLTSGRPELCNRYFCEAVRDYLWRLGGERDGERLAARLDDLQKRWTRLYAAYGKAVTAPQSDYQRSGRPGPAALRRASGWDEFFPFLQRFDAEIAAVARPVTPDEVAQRLFKVEGEPALYEPFFAAEVEAIGGAIRAPTHPEPTEAGVVRAPGPGPAPEVGHGP